MTVPKHKYLDAAVAIGRTLVRDAVWTDRRCFWLTQSEIEHEFGTQPVVTACSTSLADGARGVRLFLKRLSIHDRDPLTEEVVGGIDCFLSGSEPQADADEGDAFSSEWYRRVNDDHPSAELYRQLNQIYTALREGHLDEDRPSALLDLAGRTIQCFESDPDRYACFIDPLFADAFLVTARSARDPSSINAANLIANHVVAKTEQYGQTWHGAIGREYPPISLTEGLAGVGYFLMRLVSEQIPPLWSPYSPLDLRAN